MYQAYDMSLMARIVPDNQVMKGSRLWESANGSPFG